MRTFTSALIGAAVATIVVSGSIAIAAIPDSTTKIITGCYKKTNGELRIIDKAAKGACNAKTEVELGWNQQGVKGDAGSAGLPGIPGKDGGGTPAMYDATGAVVGSPVYMTTDTFWTGQHMVRYNLATGKLLRDQAPMPESNVFLTADCTGQAYGFASIKPNTPPNPPIFGHPVLHLGSSSLTEGWVENPTKYWVSWFFTPGIYDSDYLTTNLLGMLTPAIATLPYRVDSVGSCEQISSSGIVTPGTLNFVDFLVEVQPVTIAGLHDFTGPIAPVLVPMPG